MIAKISLAAAFLLMVAPAMASAANRDAANSAPIALRAHGSPLGIVVAQISQPNIGASDNSDDNDNNTDSNEADDNQNADSIQSDQQNAAGYDQANPPQVPDAQENDPDDASQVNEAPQPQPYQ